MKIPYIQNKFSRTIELLDFQGLVTAFEGNYPLQTNLAKISQKNALQKYFGRTFNITVKEFSEVLKTIKTIDNEAYKDLKLLLPAIIPSAVYQNTKDGHGKANLAKDHTTYIALDFDKFTEDRTPEMLFDILKNQKNIAALGFSPSGKGVWALFHDKRLTYDNHIDFFNILSEDASEAGFPLDEACKNINRLRFISTNLYVNPEYDHEAIYLRYDPHKIRKTENNELINFEQLSQLPEDPTINNSENLEYIQKKVIERSGFNPITDCHPFFLRFGAACNHYGVHEKYAVTYAVLLFQSVSTRQDRTYKDAEAAVRNAYKNYKSQHRKLKLRTPKSFNQFQYTTYTLNRKYITDSKYQLTTDDGEPITLPQKAVIKAQAGSGKTEAMVHHAERTEHGIVLALPYTILTLQQEARFKAQNMIVITGETTKEELESYKDSLKIACTYDSIPKAMGLIFRNLGKGIKYDLVIDEFHNLIQQNNFRSDAIARLMSRQKFFTNIYLLSATPIDLFKLLDFELIEFKTISQNNKNYTICEYEDAKQKLTNVFAQVKETTEEGKKIGIFCNDKKEINILYRKFRSLGYVAQRVLTTDNPEINEELQYIFTNQETKGEVQILLNTSKLADGTQIMNPEYTKILFLKYSDNSDLIQYPARFRNALNQDIIIYKPKNTQIAEDIDAEAIYTAELKKLEATIEVLKLGTIDSSIWNQKYANLLNEDNTVNHIALIESIYKMYKEVNTSDTIAHYLRNFGYTVSVTSLKNIDHALVNEVKEERKTEKAKQKKRIDVLHASIAQNPEIALSAFFEYTKDIKTKKQLKMLNINTTPAGIDFFVKEKELITETETEYKKIISAAVTISERYLTDDLSKIFQVYLKHKDNIPILEPLEMIDKPNASNNPLDLKDQLKFATFKEIYEKFKDKDEIFTHDALDFYNSKAPTLHQYRTTNKFLIDFRKFCNLKTKSKKKRVNGIVKHIGTLLEFHSFKEFEVINRDILQILDLKSDQNVSFEDYDKAIESLIYQPTEPNFEDYDTLSVCPF